MLLSVGTINSINFLKSGKVSVKFIDESRKLHFTELTSVLEIAEAKRDVIPWPMFLCSEVEKIFNEDNCPVYWLPKKKYEIEGKEGLYYVKPDLLKTFEEPYFEKNIRPRLIETSALFKDIKFKN